MAGNRERHYRIINGQIYARFVYTDDKGKRKEKHLKAESKTHARELYDRMKREMDDHGGRLIDASRMTFSDLADYYIKHHLIKAEYVEGRKVSGRRSLKGLSGLVQVLCESFGRKRLRGITYGDLDAFRRMRLKTQTIRGRQRSIASVNRELSLLRHMLNVALQEGWIVRNPFAGGKPLINAADEQKRERILTKEEESRLLDACVGPRQHLKAVIITALDTAARQGEIFKLTWRDVDLDARLITIQSTYTKTLRERTVPVSSRLAEELKHLRAAATGDPDARVFGIQSNVKRSFSAVRKITGLDNLRFHDLRHSAATRLVQGQLPLAEVARVLGHQQLNTTYRYTNADATTLQRAAAIFDAFQEPELEAGEFIN